MESLKKDPDFDRLTRVLLGKAKNGRIAIKEFKKTFPDIFLQIRNAAHSPFFRHWGVSSNVDENTQTRIVDPKILTVIGRIAKTKIRHGAGYHSGLLHTFGYLFSLLQTPYGLKRDRWTQGVIEKGLGLEHRWLSPVSSASFFERVSELMAAIAWKNVPVKNKKHLLPAGELKRKLDLLKSTRISDRPKSGSGRVKNIHSDIVWFRKPVQGQSALLVYSIQLTDEILPRLQTCFPISQTAAMELTEVNRKAVVELKYNSIVDGWTGS